MAASNTALFVIDIQNFLAQDPATRIPHADRLKAAGQKILDAARALNGKYEQSPSTIVFVQHEEPPEDGALNRGTEPWKLVFNPVDGAANELLVHKTDGDAFESNPDLAQKLKSQGVTHIITFGIQSECCVEATSKGALAAGFQVSLLKGAHSTYDAGDATALVIEKEVEDLLQGLGAKVVPFDEAITAWQAAGMVC